MTFWKICSLVSRHCHVGPNFKKMVEFHFFRYLAKISSSYGTFGWFLDYRSFLK